MILNVKTNQNKTVRYRILSLTVLYLCFLLFNNCSKKEDIYLFYDDFKDCEYVDQYKKKMYYGMCFKHNVILFKKKPVDKIYETKNIKEFQLTSKEDFFKINFRALKDVNLILIIKEDKKYKIVPVSIILNSEIIS